ncbi:MAG TPA: serine/threonine-protein kinase [Polyangia bacterium]
MSGTTPAMGTSVFAAAPRRRLGHYELFDRFAVGAMAELYLGRARGEEGFEKMVAIKRLLPRLADDTRFVQMLQIEARIHASLSHKNIVQIHDLGVSAEGEYFIVLEYVDGRDLCALLDPGPKTARPGLGKRIDDAVGLYIMSEVAEGVHFAHELRGGDGNQLGLVHRDISPTNILLSYAGEVKLSDFGVAKRINDSSVVTSLKGELGYISPEQARGAPIDRRSDIFSLGAVAFEIFTGNPLRTLSGSPDDYLKAASGIVNAPQRYRPDIPVAIERVLAGSLSPDPRDRFADARKFVDACREALASIPRPKNGEAGELKNLLASLLPPGAKAQSKLPSKVISLMPNLWEDVTVPESPMPPLLGPPPVPAMPPRPSPRPASQATPAVPSRPSRERTIPPRLAPPAQVRRMGDRLNPIGVARRRHNVAWAFLILGALLSSMLFSIHIYVMPLPVAFAYFRPAFIDITSEPHGADVYVDGKKVLGNTPAVVEVQRDHQQHVVEVHMEGFEPIRQNLRYDREVHLQVSVRLMPARKPVHP